ncbi:MAG: DUF362 domain-containing protein [Nitrospirales bacterium]|nr:DUF362 domain-containing protein [Nitrospira sp.]MDR4501770.1 DUF362 domain-containing protein [Nitrospirales bacterium]
MDTTPAQSSELTRRQFLKVALASGVMAATGLGVMQWRQQPRMKASTFIGQADSYDIDLRSILASGFQELGVTPSEIHGKRILLKPNLVETHVESAHINTHPLLIRAAIEAFLGLGAALVIVGEGPGHRRDTLQILEESGLAQVLYDDHIRFVDLNEGGGYSITNQGSQTGLANLTFPAIFQEIDWIVSLAKLKTHHWAGVTLSMKNLFGVMPGMFYGWPKNVLHHMGIHESILDITATLKPHFAIVDGIIGMEGDGPIMGTPVHTGVLVMGRNLPAVDATCSRLMGINPHKIGYLETASNWLGPIHDSAIQQRGELVSALRKDFLLLDHIPTYDGLRLQS